MRFPADRLKVAGPDAELALREWLAEQADEWAAGQYERLRTHLLRAARKQGYILPPDNKHVRQVTAGKLHGGARDGHG